VVGFYRRYFQDFASKATPMCKLLKKDEEFKWIDACAKSWEWMKASMTCLLVLIIFNWNFEFHIHIDVSNFVFEVMFGKFIAYTFDKPIYYANRLMNSAKKNYTILQRRKHWQ
jgi:hypothetical protein